MTAFPVSRVRGTYATAITAFLIEQGAPIADPSPAIAARLPVQSTAEGVAVRISDRRDRQGILLLGARNDVAQMAALLKAGFPRSVARPEGKDEPAISLEFPATVKQQMDATRARYVPTLPGHHHLKIIDSARVDEAERELASHPEREDELVRLLRHELIHRHFVHGARIVVEHVKPAGQEYQLRGTVHEFDGQRLLLRRTFRPGGHYDSLHVPRLDGDFGHLEVEEGSGVSIRTYRRRDGTLLGELSNLATPAELYPAAVRYVDLELDVLHAPPDPPRIIDQDDLERAIAHGFLEEPLISDTWAMAHEVMQRLEAGSNAANDVLG